MVEFDGYTLKNALETISGTVCKDGCATDSKITVTPNTPDDFQDCFKYLYYDLEKGTLYNLGENKVEKENRWEFHVLHENLIDFDDIAIELDGANPMAIVNYGETYKYVVISNWLLEKAKDIDEGVDKPNIVMTIQTDDYVVYKIEDEFSKWIDWAKKVKRSSWTPTTRKHNIAKVALPKL